MLQVTSVHPFSVCAVRKPLGPNSGHYFDLLWICCTTYRRYDDSCQQAAMHKKYNRTSLLQRLRQVYNTASRRVHDKLYNISATTNPQSSKMELGHGDPVDPVTLFYNELNMSTYV